MSLETVKHWISRLQKPLILVAVALLLTILQPEAFLSFSNFRSILLSISIYGLMVCGAIYPILLGGIDLAVGATAAMSGATTVIFIVGHGGTDSSVIVGVLIGLAVGSLAGVIHGLIVSMFNVPPFLITLASMNIIYGIAQLLTGNKVIPIMEPRLFTMIGGGSFLGIPSSIYILAVVAVISWIILNRTTFGREVYAVGGNPVAAQLSGINVRRVNLTAYAISGLTAAMAGIVLASWNEQAFARAAQGYESDVLAALVVGGTSLFGGVGSLQGGMFGALLIGLINNGLRLMGVPSDYHGVVRATVIIAVVAFSAYAYYRNSGLRRKRVKAKAAKAQADEPGQSPTIAGATEDNEKGTS